MLHKDSLFRDDEMHLIEELNRKLNDNRPHENNDKNNLLVELLVFASVAAFLLWFFFG